MLTGVESLRCNESKFELDELLPGAAEVQEYLRSLGIECLIGGGVGVDLLMLKYLSDLSARPHSDIDLYVPISKRGSMLRKMVSIGAHVDKYSGMNFAHGIVWFKGIKYDVFSIDGKGKNTVVCNPSGLAFLSRIRHGGVMRCDSRDDKPINIEPDMVPWNGRTFRVLDVKSQLSMTSDLGLLTNKRDVEILKRISDGG